MKIVKLTSLTARLPWPIDRHFNGLGVGGHLWRSRTHCDRQCEAFTLK